MRKTKAHTVAFTYLASLMKAQLWLGHNSYVLFCFILFFLSVNLFSKQGLQSFGSNKLGSIYNLFSETIHSLCFWPNIEANPSYIYEKLCKYKIHGSFKGEIPKDYLKLLVKAMFQIILKNIKILSPIHRF